MRHRAPTIPGDFTNFHFSLLYSQDWTLQIKYVQARDAGLYECQVSVHPPTSIFIYLNVVGEYLIFMLAICSLAVAPK